MWFSCSSSEKSTLEATFLDFPKLWCHHVWESCDNADSGFSVSSRMDVISSIFSKRFLFIWLCWALVSNTRSLLQHAGSLGCGFQKLVPWNGIKPRVPLPLGALSLNHWVTRESLYPVFLKDSWWQCEHSWSMDSTWGRSCKSGASAASQITWSRISEWPTGIRTCSKVPRWSQHTARN